MKTKHIYRIEIPSKFKEAHNFTYWIGPALILVDKKELAVACTEEQSLEVMERIACEATCFREEEAA